MIIPQGVLDYRAMQHGREIARMANGRSELFREGLSETYDLPYRSDGDERHTLDLIRPDSDERLPVVIEIHGGGYIGCEKNINRLHARWYAQHGFAVVNGDYTLHPEGDFPTVLGELADIVGWVCAHAEEYALDPERIFMSGDSAGGHLVLLCAMLQGSEALQERFGVRLEADRIKAVAATCPAFRLVSEGADLSSLIPLMYPDGISLERLRALDITRLCTQSRFPPVIVVTTPTDHLLYRDDLELETALRRSGREYAFRVYEQKTNPLDHVFNVLFPEFEESAEANSDILDFFRRHG